MTGHNKEGEEKKKKVIGKAKGDKTGNWAKKHKAPSGTKRKETPRGERLP